MSNQQQAPSFIETHDDGYYIREIHVVGRLPLREPEDEPEIVFHHDQLWQNEPMSQSDKDDDTISDAMSVDDVTSLQDEDGACGECKLSWADEEESYTTTSTVNEICQQQTPQQTSTISGEGQSGYHNLLQLGQVSSNGLPGSTGCNISSTEVHSPDR